MACTVGIICEYNPFHKGHKYQVDKIREEMPDATIIAIMSGNVVQRGDFAIIDKYDRAKIALESGINGVFEIPYPYSGSTAEIFANAGVEIANKLQCDFICFGVEDENIENIERIAEAIDSKEFECYLKEQMQDKSIGYITAKKLSLQKLGYNLPVSPNDILAIEYIRAIKNKKITLKYKCIVRTGSRYKDKEISDIMSATAIREHYFKNNSFISVPDCVRTYYEEISQKKHIIDIQLKNRMFQIFSLINKNKIECAFDSNKEISALIENAAKEYDNAGEFMESISSKRFTSSRIRRVMLYSFFEVHSVDHMPKYAFLLGVDNLGQKVLSKIRNSKDFYIITKHADLKKIPEEIRKIAEKQYVVDQIFNSLLINQKSPCEAYKNKPIIK